MIPEWVAIALLAMPCTSDVVHARNETVAHACPAPLVQGPPRPPIWWRAGMFDNTNKAILDRKETVKPKYEYKPKKKKRSKKKRRR